MIKIKPNAHRVKDISHTFESSLLLQSIRINIFVNFYFQKLPDVIFHFLWPYLLHYIRSDLRNSAGRELSGLPVVGEPIVEGFGEPIVKWFEMVWSTHS